MERPLRRRLRGYLAVMGAAALWGISGVVAKALFNRRIEPWTLVEIRLSGSFLVLLLILVLRRVPLRVPRRQLATLVLLGLAMSAAQFSYYLAISLTDVSTAIFLQYTAPVFVVLYAWFVEREPLTVLKAAAILLAIGGSYLLVTGGSGIRISPLGLTAGILSAAAFGVYALLGRGRVRELGSWTVLLYALGTGAVAWSLIVPPWRAYRGSYAGAEWSLFAFIIIFATILPFGLFLHGLRTISPSLASLTATLEPVVASAAAFLLLNEALGSAQIAGGAAIVAGVALIPVSDLLTARGETLMPPAPD
ncbi:MAG: EamA family transporter [Armatimonadetes bacterium]|nr:EamA family transporter [Armatimonadota bacterium]